jgi:hypothetical protein
VWVQERLGAEAAADRARNDAHALGRKSECRGHGIPDGMCALVRIEESDLLIAPDGGGRVRFEWIVVLGGRRIGVIERDGRRGQRGLDIAALGIRLIAIDESLRCGEIPAIGAQFHIVWLLLVANGDDRSNELPMIGDGIRLEHRQFGIVKWRKPWGVLVRKHSDDAGQGSGSARVDRHDPALAIVLWTGKT